MQSTYNPNELKLTDVETGEELIPLEVVKADFMKELKLGYSKKKQTGNISAEQFRKEFLDALEESYKKKGLV